ncbi:(2Fe-2S)-binding protein [Rhodopseudomonas palustris HaA2]|uniref:(2Fe-2S)-binding protein n=1 Tax=Rhodopseudomonas palustris (strain HaA2) TaxID=316058 RepID=Q2IVG7_RHOP2|nr:(2Fe-2S)-binding protein [Rhodopseudomonas palustris]ABD07793.1 (2Fe-2S)-binding protein [Rhodopseudomonas palustris HaA2]
MSRSIEVKLKVNGKSYVGHCESRTLMADFLRDHLNLTGTHVGCEHGVCGVCTILVDGEAVRSCIMLAAQADGADVVTIEGLSQAGAYHPVQKAFHDHHALQCGFCTPGMLATAIDFLNTNASPTEQEVREALSAVLCRCTGYQNIVTAVLEAAAAMRGDAKAGA